MASLGIRSIDEMIGRTDLLEVNTEILPWKAKNIDFSKILYRPEPSKGRQTYYCVKQNHNLEKVLDLELIAQAKDALNKRGPASIALPIKNINRASGAMLSGEACRIYAEEGLSQDSILCKFKGVAGQSFGPG